MSGDEAKQNWHDANSIYVGFRRQTAYSAARVSPEQRAGGQLAPTPSFSVADYPRGVMTTKLHVGNIPSTATDKDLEVLFGRFGRVDAVGIAKDVLTGLSRGFGYVEMANDLDAEAAINRLNFSQYGGRTIGVSRIRLKPQ